MEQSLQKEVTFTGLTTSAETDKLDAALALAQSKFEVAEKNKTNPHFRSKYADLTSIREAAKKGLAEAKISVTQWLHSGSDNRLHIVTRVAHAGQWMQSSFAIPVGRQDAHGYGSAATCAASPRLSCRTRRRAGLQGAADAKDPAAASQSS